MFTYDSIHSYNQKFILQLKLRLLIFGIIQMGSVFGLLVHLLIYWTQKKKELVNLIVIYSLLPLENHQDEKILK